MCDIKLLILKGKGKKVRYSQKKLSLNEQAAAFFYEKEGGKMNISEKLMLQQLISDAEQQGEALAKAGQHLISEDETKFLKFVDGLYNFYELMDSSQFIEFLILLGDTYDIPHLPKDVIKTDKEKADTYISSFMEAFFYAALSVISNADEYGEARSQLF